MTPNRGPVPLGGAAATAADGPTPPKHNSMTLSSRGWCPGPDDGSLAETYESQCGQDASVGRLQNLSARRSQSLRCTSVTKLMYTPRHCFVTHCRAYSFCGFVWNAHIGHKAYVHTQALFCDTLPCISFLRFCVECAMYLTNQCTC